MTTDIQTNHSIFKMNPEFWQQSRGPPLGATQQPPVNNGAANGSGMLLQSQPMPGANDSNNNRQEPDGRYASGPTDPQVRNNGDTSKMCEPAPQQHYQTMHDPQMGALHIHTGAEGAPPPQNDQHMVQQPQNQQMQQQQAQPPKAESPATQHNNNPDDNSMPDPKFNAEKLVSDIQVSPSFNSQFFLLFWEIDTLRRPL